MIKAAVTDANAGIVVVCILLVVAPVFRTKDRAKSCDARATPLSRRIRISDLRIMVGVRGAIATTKRAERRRRDAIDTAV